VIALTDQPARGGLSALDVSASERSGGRAVAVFGAPGLLVTAAGETADGYVPVRAPSRGAADTPAVLHSDSLSARLQRDIDGMSAAVRLGAFEERRGAGLAGADSRATGANASFTLARSRDDGGWRLQTWVFSSDLANSSVAVAANRATTTPANNEFSTPALGYGANAAWQMRRGPWSWELGADTRFAQGREHEYFRFLGGAFTRTREAGGRTAIGGVYAEGVLDQGDLILTGGARLDAWSQTDAVRRERDAVTGALTLDSSAPNSSGVTPTARLGARWALAGGTWLRAAAYAGFRPPTLNELHRPFRVGNDVTEANPELTPEKLYGVEAGLGGQGPVAWSTTLYLNRLDDPITNVTLGVGPGTFPLAGVVPAGGTFRKRENAGEIDAYGLEGDANRQLGDLTLEAAFSATHARIDGGSVAPQLTGKRPAETPRVSATLGLRWRASERLTLTGAALYESARYDDDLNTRRIAPSAQLDLRAAWRVAADSEVYLAIQNAADAKIEVGQTADGTTSLSAPRTIRVGFALKR
jgi:outer membrane receptor protein involved in Fe transport